ncbi:hypothetical protein DPMN_127774 [Dreissena polymorpha]|uniref:Uncharacterized protein n=1 Tax=Dreissena polymorpha TaxID=45954 RepID=A0A9D4JV52_DREPO|nr:hypothetical protein DPMN_127774 [Dreissena polymorpha]
MFKETKQPLTSQHPGENADGQEWVYHGHEAGWGGFILHHGGRVGRHDPIRNSDLEGHGPKSGGKH